jgi:hypothetical protein
MGRTHTYLQHIIHMLSRKGGSKERMLSREGGQNDALLLLHILDVERRNN